MCRCDRRPLSRLDEAYIVNGEDGPRGWWRIMDTRIGIVPLPVFVVIVALILAYRARGKVPPTLRPTS